jgi:predicted nucleic acid-binding protein
MRLLIDTCVFSEAQRPQGDLRVKTRVSLFEQHEAFLSVITIGELANGIALLDDGGRKRGLASWFGTLQQNYSTRILPIDAEIARRWGELSAASKRNGSIIPIADGLIAASALKHGLTVVTRNTRHFAACGVAVIDPWEN